MRCPYLFLFTCGLLWTCVCCNKIDDLVPGVLQRLSEVREVLAPLPRDVLEEALYHTASYYIPVDSETEHCRNHSEILFDSFLNYEIWAIKMVDASSKGGPGMLDGNFMDLGNYGQCVNVKVPQDLFYGQLCVVETRGIMPTDMDLFNPTRPVFPSLRIDLLFSVCVPSSCTAQDIQTHMDVALNSVNASSIVYNSSCSSGTPIPYQKKDCVTVVVLVFIGIFIVLGTWLDNRHDLKGEKNQLVLRCFSLRKSGDRLTAMSPGGLVRLSCLHGLRVVAMAWMMLGYRMLHLLASPNFRFKYLVENIDKVAWAPIENALLSMEIFFLVSGVLVTYKFFKNKEKKENFSYMKFFLRYYLRLTPPLALMTLLYASVLIHVTEGPIWRRLFQFQREFCQKHWWTNLLYVSNYINPYEMCMPQTWYLAVEFQMYVLSPLILVPLYKNASRGFIIIITVFLATVVGGLINTYVLGIQAGGLIRLDRTREGTNVLAYFHTQYRAASFLMGMALGYLLYKVEEGAYIVKLSKLKLLLGWVAAVCLILGSMLLVFLFQDPEYVYTPWLDTAYAILHRPVFSLGVAWIILVCSIGRGGLINRLLSCQTAVFLSRLTYCVFLVFFIIQDVQAFSIKSAVTTDFLNLWYVFFADFFISYVLGSALYFAVEGPVLNLLDYLFDDGTPVVDSELPSRLNDKFVDDDVSTSLGVKL